MYVKKFINLILERVCRGCRHHFRGQIIPDVYHTIGKEMLKRISHPRTKKGVFICKHEQSLKFYILIDVPINSSFFIPFYPEKLQPLVIHLLYSSAFPLFSLQLSHLIYKIRNLLQTTVVTLRGSHEVKHGPETLKARSGHVLSDLHVGGLWRETTCFTSEIVRKKTKNNLTSISLE